MDTIYNFQALAVAVDEKNWYYVVLVYKVTKRFGIRFKKKVYSESIIFPFQTGNPHYDGLGDAVDEVKHRFSEKFNLERVAHG